MTFIERVGLALLHRIDPETGHSLSIKALNWGLSPRGPAPAERRESHSTRMCDLRCVICDVKPTQLCQYKLTGV